MPYSKRTCFQAIQAYTGVNNTGQSFDYPWSPKKKKILEWCGPGCSKGGYAIHRIKNYSVDSKVCLLTLIHWIAIYPVDSVYLSSPQTTWAWSVTDSHVLEYMYVMKTSKHLTTKLLEMFCVPCHFTIYSRVMFILCPCFMLYSIFHPVAIVYICCYLSMVNFIWSCT